MGTFRLKYLLDGYMEPLGYSPIPKESLRHPKHKMFRY